MAGNRTAAIEWRASVRRKTPPLLRKMLERQVGELVVMRDRIIEPKTGCRVAYDFPNEAAAVNAALRMNEIVDWFGLIKARADGHQPNCEAELNRIAEDFGGKLANGNTAGMAESICAKVVADVERS
jgi:hypothetical protein